MNVDQKLPYTYRQIFIPRALTEIVLKIISDKKQ